MYNRYTGFSHTHMHKIKSCNTQHFVVLYSPSFFVQNFFSINGIHIKCSPLYGVEEHRKEIVFRDNNFEYGHFP